MDEEKNIPSFLEDDRVKFVEEKVCGLLRVHSQTWQRNAVSEEFQAPLKNFFEKQSLVFFSSSKKGCLVASNEVPPDAKNEQIYLLKKRVVPVTSENCRELLLFGLLTPPALLQLSCAVKQICVPLLSDNKNHQTWPLLISEDILRHVEIMCSQTSVVQGRVMGKTVLPIPVAADWMEKSHSIFEKHENYDRAVAHAIETQVINWTNLIQKILKEDSSDILITGCNPGPSAELKFWASRKNTIESIYHQLQSPVIQMMMKMLETMDSSYHPTIKMQIGKVCDALREAEDIDLHLQPLHAQLSHLEIGELPLMETYMPALFHTLYLIWTNCRSYQRPARIVVLLQELCNLLIEQASTYLSADLLLREDPEESLQMVKRVIKVCRCFKDSYQTQRERLASQVKHAPWDFPSAMIFSRFNQFFNRVQQLEEFFEIMLHYKRIEKLEFGGTKGKLYSEHAAKMHKEFSDLCQALIHSKNCPLDLNSQGFESEYKNFRVKIADIECRLARFLCLVFKDCSGLESAMKMLTIAGPFLEKRQIRQIFGPNFLLLQQHFREELETCKHLLKLQLNQMETSLMKNMAHASGAFKWAKMLRERIQRPWEKFRMLFGKPVEGADMVTEYSMYTEILNLLDQFEKNIYSDWCRGLEQTCLINLNQSLISRNPSSGLISVNFNPKLTEALKDVKYFQTLSEINIPPDALAVFEKREMFTKYVNSLQLLVQWYNKLKQTVLEVELPLIRAELESVDLQLSRAETSLTWQDEDCWSFISNTKHLVQDLFFRVNRVRENCDAIQSVMKRWSKQAMFCRKDNKKGSLIQLDERGDSLRKKYSSMKNDGDYIHGLVQENMVLFHADPDSEEWHCYLEYLDDMVVEGLFSYISRSLHFFVENMEAGLNQTPLFEAKLILNGSKMTFCPSMENDAGDSLYELIEGLVADVFKTSVNIRRVAAHLSMESYQDVMDDMLDLLDLRQEIMDRVENVQKKAINYQTKFDCYTRLWQDDRAEFLRQFLLYGRALTSEEMEACRADALPDNPPTINNFKEQIDYYEDLHDEISHFEDFRVFDGWFRVDIKHFKVSLLNTLKRWSWLFKEHLLTNVTHSLDELQKFIQATVEGLNQPIAKEDNHGFVEVMSHLLAVKDRQNATDKMFEPLRETVILLEQYGVTIPDQIYWQMEELPEKWSGAKKLALRVRHEVAPMKNAEVMVLRRRCMDFEVKQTQFREMFRAMAPFSYKAVNPYSSLEKAEKAIRDMEREVAELQESASLLDVSISDYRDIKLCRREITILKELWDIVVYVQSSVENWTMTKWRQINVDQMDAELRRLAKDIQKLDKEARSWDVYSGLDLYVKNLLTSLQAVTQLQNPAIRERHWVQLIRTTQMDFTVTDSTTLENLLALQLHLFEEEVRNIVEKAVKEMAIEKVVTEISQTWMSMELSYEDHYQTSVPLLKCDEQLIETLEDHQVQLQSVFQNKHIDHFLHQVVELQKQLTVADSVLMVWMEVQRTWAYLESIFKGCDDICQQLPGDTHRFKAIDAEFQELMLGSAMIKNVIEATNKPLLLEKLEDLQKRLALCEKALAEYLETKRLAFPRFYFISSADLLDILSKGSRPREVTGHLSKIFDNLSDLEFSKNEQLSNPKVAVGMYSKEREFVPFQTECLCRGPVEAWLSRLEESMKECVKGHLSEAVSVYEDRPREQWILDFPAQVALAGSQIWWTNDMELVFKRLEEGFESALKDYNKKQVSQLNMLIGMLLGELSSGDRQKIMTVCTIDVHARDIVASLIAKKVTTSQAFPWLSQLRHYWNEQLRHCYINICDAQFIYSYEYLGNTPRLVITPLTDRCYITLTQSLHLNMSGAPSGPAGTGKTETTKDLGRAVGVMVYVFNCSEQMDYKSIGNIYKGLAQTGAWGCFDEFNRIPVDVLSVVAVQVKTIQDAIRSKKERFLFLDKDIALKHSVGIFVTMNPGYAGRTELPENLKSLFRPCAMVVPDTELICEIMLVAEGFRDAKLLAKKFITLYTLCKELLSKQDHYDWGLRAVKSVLVLAGALRRRDKTRAEDQVLMRALRDFNMSKIVTEDVPVFMGLLGDLFPDMEVERERDLEFEKAIRKTTLDLRLQPEETFILKVVQLEELMAVRHSVFVVGNAGTGKSQILRVLHKTYVNLKRKPVWNDLNPKAIDRDELFGFIHPATREWKDGLLSSLMREQANISHSGPKWIVLDGDIDPMWIESLNTVMDDNKVLTLASNERVALTSSMRLIFEISHLRMATPATVSRAGILYVNQQDLGWNPYVASWIDQRERQTERAHLTILFEKYVPRCLEQMKNTFKTITPIPEISMVQTLCTLLDCLLTPENVPSESPREIYETYFTFACIWAFGGALYQDQLCDYRAEFSQWWTKEMKTVKLPAQGTVFDYYLDHQTRRFLPWSDTVPPFEMDTCTPLQAVLVHTAETVRLRYFMDLLLERRQPVMLVGNAGVGKTALVRNKLDCLPESYMTTKVPLNYYTSSLMLQAILERPLEKRAGRSYSPVGNRRLIYFIDDMNMPAMDNYGTVQPHTLIRQHLDYGHCYDRQKLTLKEIHNTQYVACMNPTAGTFIINPRLQRHFSVFAVNFPSCDAQRSIFSQILCSHLKQQLFSPLVQSSAAAAIQAAITLHHKMVHNFLPTAIKFHYTFNLRDLSNVFQGILFSGPENVKDSADLVQLWLHESCRVYSDRLVDLKDLQLFQKLQLETMQECFEGLEDIKVKKQPLLYCHFAQMGEKPSYAPVTDWSALSTILTDALESYNEIHPAMNLVLFEDAMQHVCRISRILETPRGHGLLVGVGGSGKQSLTRLAAYISSVEVFQIILSKGYTVQDFKMDLAGLFLKAGVQNKRVALLLTDAQIPDDRFLVIINDFLASGEVPEVFSEEEIESIVSGVRAEVRGLGLLDSRENCWKFFTDRVGLQLKVVLCFSPVGNALQVRARHFPALINSTIIDWFYSWTPEALQSVSYRFIQEVEGIEPAVQESISLFMAYVHTSVNQASEKYQRNEKRYNYTTPKSFLQQITLYRNLLEKSGAQLQHKMNRLDSGLQKLQTTAAQVEDLKAKLASQEAELTLKNENIEALIAKIGQQTERVTSKREAADVEAQKVAVIQAEIVVKQKECENDLAKAEPLLAAATAALNTLNKVNLTELKAFPNPPAAVINVAAAVMVLLAPHGRVPKDRSWKAARAFMGKVDDFLQALMSYDKEHIPESCLTVVKQEYLRNPDFHPDLVWTKSTAAAGLCAWTINIVRYYEIYCEVIPKRHALSQANAELETATAKLLALQKKLADLDASLQSITAQYEMATAEKISCQEEVTRTTQTIELANRLVKGLMSEKERWSLKIVQFEKQKKTLCGDVLLTSAFVSYMGYFTSQYRVELFNNKWIPFLRSLKVSVPLTDGLDPVLMLTDDATVAAWHNQGLPNDRMSIENAAILTTSERWPLIIDPQQQGIKWIRNQLASDLRVVQLGQKGCLDVIEQALVFGETVVIENLPEKVDPVLEPLLSRKTVKRGRYILIGGKECAYNSNFKLILHTKLANPHFPPELQAQTTLINFTVTPTGLEEQLLGQVVSRERPDLEELKTKLTTQQNHFKIELRRFEDDLLSRLSAAHGNFLGDIYLVEQLENTKTTAAHIQCKVAEARENERKINEARELYRPAAERASLLFFIIDDLSKINLMYQFSLKTFNSVFNKAMERAEWDEDVRTRVRSLTEAITYSVFLYTSQGLFERDKLTFLSHTAFQIQLKQKLIDIQELDFLLRYPVEASKVSPVPFLSTSAWGAIKTISTIEGFSGLDRDIESSPNRWRKIVESSCPENERLPQDWKNMSSLQRLIILRALRPDRMTYTLRKFVEESMGAKYVDSARLEFEKLFEDSGPSTPVFFILSPGVDPLRDVEKLGLKLGFSIDQGTLHNVSLGQGQEIVAERVLRNASKHGHWVILQNVHLVAQWLPSLDALLETTAVVSHPSYRVFITGEPAPCPEQHVIPRGILENAIKITNEPPTGMNASLHAALSNFSQDTLDMCSREQEFNSMLFSLCFFHSCVTERRKFGPRGWNNNYPFSTGDLTISANVLYNYLETNTKTMQVPWEDLCYLFGEIMYGGHITDDWDRRLCKTYLQEFMHPKMFEMDLSLCPGFLSPPFLDYTGYHRYIDEHLPSENPTLYGLHPNAELECLTVTSDNLLKALLELQPQNSSRGEGAAQSTEEKVTSIIEDILDKLPEEYNMAEIMAKTTERNPYTLVCFQECERMNLLLAEIKKSLHELDLGLKGELAFSSRMENLQSALFMEQVPDSWAKLAYSATKTLAQWLNDLMCSCHELDSWTQDFVLPAVVWLSGLFNPQSFLTAVLQSIARKNKWPLDKMTLSVDVTKKMKDDFGHPPREGAYIHGLFMEGARWDTQAGVISEAVLRELTPAMPVLYVRAVPAEERDISNTFECPVYRTKQRGHTYVWTLHLRTKQPAAKWIVAGVALLLSV
ncbi:LOW QUALITY PROTEIN: dynein heavy chain 11, axonemal [Oreochromis niloticus]|uniref:LOW QUALITY PROTEIN: dynein heavy chain 11, axonemal n=1 Tax=Oreochromis niloticus TaxID=8128 RepID=UPI0006749084|nr:LOW QUALITY PROTEIN: dynein heavy chain 11, axonemal [Oreochromis niloticus]